MQILTSFFQTKSLIVCTPIRLSDVWHFLVLISLSLGKSNDKEYVMVEEQVQMADCSTAMKFSSTFRCMTKLYISPERQRYVQCGILF